MLSDHKKERLTQYLIIFQLYIGTKEKCEFFLFYNLPTYGPFSYSRH